jgi:hypothetical protein
VDAGDAGDRGDGLIDQGRVALFHADHRVTGEPIHD